MDVKDKLMEVFFPLPVTYIEQFTHALNARDEVDSVMSPDIRILTFATAESFKTADLKIATNHCAFYRWLDLRDQKLQDVADGIVKERNL